jgi:hypothetical protein
MIQVYYNYNSTVYYDSPHIHTNTASCIPKTSSSYSSEEFSEHVSSHVKAVLSSMIKRRTEFDYFATKTFKYCINQNTLYVGLKTPVLEKC